ncbi:FAD-binding oxidoreductase [Kineococcus gynurae]|uniref:FAD-binding oxidoreductase n=1 Tax=Kineococcus gynurae TaxID=452979 RepID=A0ABV5LUY7_9ACTN
MGALSRGSVLRLLSAVPFLTVLGATPARADAARRPGRGPDAGAILAGVRGPVLRPGDDGWSEEVGGFNLAHTPVPDLVVGAASADDVALAVRWARATGHRVSTQATGHGLRGDLAGTVLVSTRRLDRVVVDPRARTARIGAGVRWRQVVEAAAPHGLAPLSGSSSAVGAVGYTLGGGVGLLSRRYGFAADRVRSLEVVTADGHRRPVDVLHHPDLFWALRGARDGLAVVTAMTIDLVPVSSVQGGGIFFDGSAAAPVLHAWRTWAASLPDHVGTSLAFLRLPPDPALPEPLRGRFVVHVRFVSTGTAAEAEALLRPVRAAAPALLDSVGDLPWTAVDAVHGDPTQAMPAVESGTGVRDLDRAAAEALLARVDATSGCVLAMVELRRLGGAMARPARVPDAATGRGAAFSVMGLGVPAGPGAELVGPQLAALRAAVGPWSVPGPLNLAGAGDHTGLWTPGDRARLAAIRRRHDPCGTLA